MFIGNMWTLNLGRTDVLRMWVYLPQAGSIFSLFTLPSVFQESFIKFPPQIFVHSLLSLIFFVALKVGVPYSCVL